MQLIEIEGLKKDRDHYKNLYELQDNLLKEAKKQIEDLKKIAKDYEDLKVDNAKIVEQLRSAEIRKKELEDEVSRLQNENKRIKNDLIGLRDDIRNILEIIKNQTPEIKRVLLDIINNENIRDVIDISDQLNSMIEITG